MKSAGNRGVLKGRLQKLHIHILFVASLGTSHMEKLSSGTLPTTRVRWLSRVSVSSIPSSTFLADSFSFMERSSSTTAQAFLREVFLTVFFKVKKIDHDFDHFQVGLSYAPLSQKGRLGRPKIGNGLYWDAKSSVHPLPESWGSRGREFDSLLGPIWLPYK